MAREHECAVIVDVQEARRDTATPGVVSDRVLRNRCVGRKPSPDPPVLDEEGTRDRSSPLWIEQHGVVDQLARHAGNRLGQGLAHGLSGFHLKNG